MNCPYCTSPVTKEQRKKTALGYRVFRCSVCQRLFNERTGTPFNFLEYSTDIVYGPATSSPLCSAHIVPLQATTVSPCSPRACYELKGHGAIKRVKR